jgi:hypothetical protein
VILKERTEIGRPAAHVWRFIITSELFLQWNDKVVDMEARGEFQRDQRFHTRYEMNHKQLQCWSQVTKLEEGRLLELRHGNCSGQGIHRGIEVTERITLEEKGVRTIVRKDVIIRNSGIPWFVVPLIWFLNRFGKPVQPDKLKAMCEGHTV